MVLRRSSAPLLVCAQGGFVHRDVRWRSVVCTEGQRYLLTDLELAGRPGPCALRLPGWDANTLESPSSAPRATSELAFTSAVPVPLAPGTPDRAGGGSGNGSPGALSAAALSPTDFRRLYTPASDLYQLGKMMRETSEACTLGRDGQALMQLLLGKRFASAADALRHGWVRCEACSARAGGGDGGETPAARQQCEVLAAAGCSTPAGGSGASPLLGGHDRAQQQNGHHHSAPPPPMAGRSCVGVVRSAGRSLGPEQGADERRSSRVLESVPRIRIVSTTVPPVGCGHLVLGDAPLCLPARRRRHLLNHAGAKRERRTRSSEDLIALWACSSGDDLVSPAA